VGQGAPQTRPGWPRTARPGAPPRPRRRAAAASRPCAGAAAGSGTRARPRSPGAAAAGPAAACPPAPAVQGWGLAPRPAWAAPPDPNICRAAEPFPTLSLPRRAPGATGKVAGPARRQDRPHHVCDLHTGQPCTHGALRMRACLRLYVLLQHCLMQRSQGVRRGRALSMSCASASARRRARSALTARACAPSSASVSSSCTAAACAVRRQALAGGLAARKRLGVGSGGTLATAAREFLKLCAVLSSA